VKRLSGRLSQVLPFVTLLLLAFPTLAEPPPMGVVIMHGKGGSPAGSVAKLARGLEAKGYLVESLDMPWSRRRDYDVPPDRAEEEVVAALSALRAKGAQKVFVAGHSQGGGFALHLAGKIAADGFIAVSPGGDVGNMVFREQLGGTVAQARQLVAEGKGDQRTNLQDYEGAKGKYPIETTPALYLAWFDAESAMNIQRAARAAKPEIPILWIVAKNDYPGLRRTMIPLFEKLPRHPLTRLYEPNSDHLGTPAAAVDEIVRWTNEVAKTSPR
jgi:pimeloyl-ACP methyl ester carboxylesterase